MSKIGRMSQGIFFSQFMFSHVQALCFSSHNSQTNGYYDFLKVALNIQRFGATYLNCTGGVFW